MMRGFKVILVLIVLLLSTSFVTNNDYTNNKIQLQTNNSYGTEIYVDWKSSGSGYWTETDDYYIYNDFDFMVSRSKKTINGYYYFDIWFFSQSYYWDGVEATYTATNIKDIVVTVDVGYGSQKVTEDHTDLGITFDGQTHAPTLRFISTYNTPYVWITWQSMSAK